MNNWPTQIWALLLAALGAALAIVFYLYPSDVTTRQSAFQIASSLVSGALGAFAGHALAGGNTTTATGQNPTINLPTPTAPVTPLAPLAAQVIEVAPNPPTPAAVIAADPTQTVRETP